MRIIFIRHGEPDYEHDCLTDLGKKQAEAVAEKLKSEKIDELWVSPLGRAMETAEPIRKALNLPIQTLDFMRELEWGSIDGTPLFSDGHPWNIVDEMARQGINLSREDWREETWFKNNLVVRDVDRIESKIDEWLEGLGYKREGYYYRHSIGEEEHKTIALVSHGGSSSAAMGHILNIPFPQMCAMFHIGFTGIRIIRFDKEEGPCTLPRLEQ